MSHNGGGILKRGLFCQGLDFGHFWATKNGKRIFIREGGGLEPPFPLWWGFPVRPFPGHPVVWGQSGTTKNNKHENGISGISTSWEARKVALEQFSWSPGTEMQQASGAVLRCCQPDNANTQRKGNTLVYRPQPRLCRYGF